MFAVTDEQKPVPSRNLGVFALGEAVIRRGNERLKLRRQCLRNLRPETGWHESFGSVQDSSR